ncbi:HNH endonuclease [Ceratobasidium sp. AG-Ba]|nr:HNH endonuclease [Ceratobasidium sp. AG-Ba]
MLDSSGSSPRFHSSNHASDEEYKSLLYSSDNSTQSEDAAERVQDTSTSDSCCIITLSNQSTRACRVLSDELNEEDAKQLEFAWGLKTCRLDLGNARNAVMLKSNLATSFARGDWALVPSEDTLKTAARQTAFDGGLRVTARKLYAQLDSQQIYDYSFVHFKGPTTDILRRNAQTGHFDTFSAPYNDFPIIHSHIHPCFVICDVALKDIKYGYHEVLGDGLSHRVTKCHGLYKSWLSAKPRESPSPPRLNSGEQSTDPALYSGSDISDVDYVTLPQPSKARIEREVT